MENVKNGYKNTEKNRREKMKRNGKRGFTIVELVVVIAVVAILAAVLIPTFASVIKKANVSNDVVLVKELNDGLKMEEVGGKKNDTMTDALNVAKDYGFEVEKLTPRSSGEILWDSVNNRFVLLDENGDAVYKDESKTLSSGANLWKIVNNAEEAANNTEYSSYIKGNATIETLTVTNGVDVGENKVNELTYENITGTKKTVTIRTNGGNLTVNAATDEVNHHNNLTSVNVQAVAPNSYHEFGKVLGTVKVESGHVKVENGAEVASVIAVETTAEVKATITAEEGSKVGTVVVNDAAAKVEVKTGAEVTEVAPGKTGITVDVTGKEASTTVIDTEKASNFEGGLGTKASPYLIANKGQFEKITSGYIDNIKYYSLIGEVTFTESDELAGARWGYAVYLPKKVSYIKLNGNGKYIKCESAAAVFDIIGNSTVMNLNVEIKNKFATQTIGVTFEGVNFYGNVSWNGGNNGLICAYVTDGLTAINCNNYATINSTGGEADYNAIFTGYAFTENATLSFKNCNNYGSLISGKASMFIGNVRYKSKLVVENCLNKGEIRATYMGYTPNCYVSVSESNIISLTLNGETKTLDTVLSSGFYHGPSDTMALTENADNTLTFTKSNNKTVAYYVVSVGVYTKFDQGDGLEFNSGATDRVYVTQRIEATEAETYVTELKVLSFVDNAWAKNNAGAVAGKLVGNDIYTLNDNTYYFISSTKHSVDGKAKAPMMVTVSAYAADGTLISSASLAK